MSFFTCIRCTKPDSFPIISNGLVRLKFFIFYLLNNTRLKIRVNYANSKQMCRMWPVGRMLPPSVVESGKIPKCRCKVLMYNSENNKLAISLKISSFSSSFLISGSLAPKRKQSPRACRQISPFLR